MFKAVSNCRYYISTSPGFTAFKQRTLPLVSRYQYVPVVVPWSVTPSILQAWELRPKEANQCPACAPALAVSTSDEVMILDSPLFGQIGPNNDPNNDTLLPVHSSEPLHCSSVRESCRKGIKQIVSVNTEYK